MDKKIIKGLIEEKLETIQEQFSIIKEYEGKIPVIEIDIVMANIRDLYELFLTLEIENTGLDIASAVAPPKSRQEIPLPPPVTLNPVAEEPPLPETEPGFEPEPEMISEVLADELPPVSEPEYHPQSENTIPPPTEPASFESRKGLRILGFEPVAEEEPVKEQQPEKPPKITFDLFSDGHSTTLADRYKSDTAKRVADQLGQNKVVDLRTTIGINDKFLFINELFEGNMRVYDEAVEKLNECVTLAQADLLLLDLKIVYNWDGESPTVKKFVDLSRRKF